MIENITRLEEAIDQAMTGSDMPCATYRLQLNAQFTFHQTIEIVDYLHDLGISHLYTSPLFKPRSGSTHGYDVVDYTEFNPVLGGEEAFDTLVEKLHEHDMGMLLDIVPNHMGVNTENEWWMDVLKHGPSSVYADYFDIDWRPRNRALDNKLLLPVLGDHYGRILEAGELELVYWHGDFYIHYYEHQFPVTPETYKTILKIVHEELLKLSGYEDWVEMELSSLIVSLAHLPPYTSKEPDDLTVRRREQVIIRWRLLALFDNSDQFRKAIDAALERLNGFPGDPASFDTLDTILRRQPYRVSYWRVAADEINYRRFFDINDMAAIRIENPQVFEDTHRLAVDLLAKGAVNGLRIDHPDGLWDPEMYFFRLQEMYVTRRVEHILGEPLENTAPITERLRMLHNINMKDYPLYIVVEKILSETEPLPEAWAVHGTTGYRFLNNVNNLFVDSENEASFNQVYVDFSGMTTPFDELTDHTKKLMMNQSLNSEIESRGAQLSRIVEGNRRYQGFSRSSLSFGLSEIIARLPIYRTYITGPGKVSERDRTYIEEAVQAAKTHNPLLPSSVFDFLQATLLMENLQDFSEKQRQYLREFVMQFQQITGPVMAKSLEDTAFYVYNRLVSLNEVGGHPVHFGLEVDEYHAYSQNKDFPHTMLSTSTHDTKRSEDVRARLNVLSEMPDAWGAAVRRWAEMNADAKTKVEGHMAPSPNDEYLFYQTLLGIYQPDDDPQIRQERLTAYMYKAINEAKVRSNWVNPNRHYADATAVFIETVLADESFMADFREFAEDIMQFGWLNSLAQTLLKLTGVGVPDIYQGCDMWDFSLVDPDNRRPVDYDQRRASLKFIRAQEQADRAGLARHLLENITDGAIKLYITYRTLVHRRENQGFFHEARYIPIHTAGAKKRHLVAFLRQLDNEKLLVLAPRLWYGLADGDYQTVLTGEAWGDMSIDIPLDLTEVENLFTGVVHRLPERQLKLSDALKDLPVGLFVVR